MSEAIHNEAKEKASKLSNNELFTALLDVDKLYTRNSGDKDISQVRKWLILEFDSRFPKVIDFAEDFYEKMLNGEVEPDGARYIERWVYVAKDMGYGNE